MPETTLINFAETFPYIVQNLKSVYGVPECERGLDPLDVLIQTILSQSTTNVNSDRAFESLKRRFPTWEQARRARVTSIEAAIRSGGLARQKSVRIKRLLNEIYESRGSLDLSFLFTAPLEEAVRFLASFKGVGPKTVACTLLFACDRPVFPIDTHIFRIARRVGLIPQKCSDEEAHRLMTAMIPNGRFYEVHINMIRHGRKVCRPQQPLCEQCCLLDYCFYYEKQSHASEDELQYR
ncbi:MAG TPA: endonuclease III [Blastocatellia bacterium]|jgi:endonuclease-3|nr:endonuclease III [Blastocatellia bacterium]